MSISDRMSSAEFDIMTHMSLELRFGPLSQAGGGAFNRSVTTRASLTLESVEVSVFPL